MNVFNNDIITQLLTLQSGDNLNFPVHVQQFELSNCIDSIENKNLSVIREIPGERTMANKVREPMPAWGKVYTVIAVIIILGLNIAGSAVNAYTELQCLKNRQNDPYHIDAVYDEISYVTDGNGDTYAIGIDYYEKVDPNAPKKSDNSDEVDTVFTAVGATEIFLFVPNVLAIVLAANLYKAVRKKKDGIKAGANIAGIIISGVLLAGCGFMAVGLSVYMQRARAAATPIAAHAPVIYLYTEEETPVNVQLDLNGEFTFTYPRYIEDRGWNVTASPSGTLTDNLGNKYDFLFWQADMYFDYDLSRGFCVPGDQTEEFLYAAAYELGLNEKEAAAFVGYWSPYMRDNEYNVITFQTECFDEAAELYVSPEPDVVLRVNMLWYASDEYVDIKAQDLTAIGLPLSERHGFTLVEWGGEFLE